MILCTAGVALPEFAFAVILDGEVSATLDPGDAIIAQVESGRWPSQARRDRTR